MSTDLFGILPLPAPIPETDAAVTDPALDLLLAFMKAVINADLADAWAAVCPTDPIPVQYTFAHNPDLESFNADETPALYIWRDDDGGTQHRYSQDYVADEGGICVLWVPPPAEQDDRRKREPFRNGLKKSLKRAFAQGRHPAWVIDGDDYYEPAIYGSVLLKHLAMAKCRLGPFRAHTLTIEGETDKFKQSYDCLFFKLETLEFSVGGTDAYDTIDHAEGTVSLPTRDGDPLVDAPLAVVSPGETLTFQFEFDVTAPVDPITGPAAGGTIVTFDGKQIVDGMTVAFGGTDSENVEFVDESTFTAEAPPHAAGVVDIVVTHPSGASKTLSGAFTFT